MGCTGQMKPNGMMGLGGMMGPGGPMGPTPHVAHNHTPEHPSAVASRANVS